MQGRQYPSDGRCLAPSPAPGGRGLGRGLHASSSFKPHPASPAEAPPANAESSRTGPPRVGRRRTSILWDRYEGRGGRWSRCQIRHFRASDRPSPAKAPHRQAGPSRTSRLQVACGQRFFLATLPTGLGPRAVRGRCLNGFCLVVFASWAHAVFYMADAESVLTRLHLRVKSMESVSDYYPGTNHRTRVWITADGRKEVGKCVSPTVLALFESRATKGFQEYTAPSLRKEGDGVWAFGPKGDTSRICGHFLDDARSAFVITGGWKGKCGRGKSRPPRADTVVGRAERIKRDGVQFPGANDA